MKTAKKDLTLILPNPLLSFMMHMDPCVLSYLDANSLPFKLFRYSNAICYLQKGRFGPKCGFSLKN